MTGNFKEPDCFCFSISHYSVSERLIPSNKNFKKNHTRVKEPMVEKITRTRIVTTESIFSQKFINCYQKYFFSRLSIIVFFAEYIPEFPFQAHNRMFPTCNKPFPSKVFDFVSHIYFQFLPDFQNCH